MNVREIYDSLPEPYRTQMLVKLKGKWEFERRFDQIVPPATHVHGIIAGRGAGKTRATLEWVREKARTPDTRILLVARTAADVRDILIEGESGLLTITDPTERPSYYPSKRRLEWSNGSAAFCTSADEPDSLRGIQVHYAAGDEATSWSTSTHGGLTAFDSMIIATRLGAHPQVVVNGTPHKASQVTEYLQDALEAGDPGVSVAHAPTYANSGLSKNYVDKIREVYGGTASEATEIYGQFPPR